LASYTPKPPFRGVCERQGHEDAEFDKQHRHADPAEHPAGGGVEPFPGIQHEQLVKVTFIQDDEHIEQHKGRGVGHIFAVGEGGEGQPRQRPERAGGEKHERRLH